MLHTHVGATSSTVQQFEHFIDCLRCPRGGSNVVALHRALNVFNCVFCEAEIYLRQ